MDFATMLTRLIECEIARNILTAKQLPIEDEANGVYIASETVGEVIDKLLILHIRTWHLEDSVDNASDEELVQIQRKLRHCFRTKRPRLVAALNEMLLQAVAHARYDLLNDQDVKVYKGQ